MRYNPAGWRKNENLNLIKVENIYFYSFISFIKAKKIPARVLIMHLAGDRAISKIDQRVSVNIILRLM